MVYKWLNNVQHALLPYSCALCGQAAQHHLALCESCHNSLNFIDNSCPVCAIPMPDNSRGQVCGQCLKHPPRFDYSTSLFRYEYPFQQLIGRLKFGGKMHLARTLGQLLADQVYGQVRPEAIVPVPLSDRRLRERGFNQALELARPVARRLDIPLLGKLVRRTCDKPAQSTLDLKHRQANVRGCFELTTRPTATHIAIIDDVVTSGATCNELARVLKQAGVQRVDVWSIARAEK